MLHPLIQLPTLLFQRFLPASPFSPATFRHVELPAWTLLSRCAKNENALATSTKRQPSIIMLDHHPIGLKLGPGLVTKDEEPPPSSADEPCVLHVASKVASG